MPHAVYLPLFVPIIQFQVFRTYVQCYRPTNDQNASFVILSVSMMYNMQDVRQATIREARFVQSDSHLRCSSQGLPYPTLPYPTPPHPTQHR